MTTLQNLQADFESPPDVDEPLSCPTCGGDSYNIEEGEDEDGSFRYAAPCKFCRGDVCPDCHADFRDGDYCEHLVPVGASEDDDE